MEFTNAETIKQHTIKRRASMLEGMRNVIATCIQDASNNGHFRIVWYDDIDAATISKLELSGYSVKKATTEQGDGWEINWQ